MIFLKRYASKIILFIAGVLVGFFISRLPLQFEEKINSIQFANLILTILLVAYVEFVVRPGINDKRNEKDLLIEQLGEIKKSLSGIHDFYLQLRFKTFLSPDDKSAMILKFREFSNNIDLLRQMDSACKKTQGLKLYEKNFSAYLDSKKALTGNKFDDDDFCYEKKTWSAHTAAIRNNFGIIVTTIIEVNKS